MKFDVLDIKGKKKEQTELPEEIYSVEMNEDVLHRTVKAVLANKRQGTHSVKTRSTISGTGKKPFRQKGTGGARQGSTRSPLMPGGAVVHGPSPRDYRQGVNKKVKQLAVRVALSERVRHNKLVVVDDLSFKEFKTKQVLELLKSVKSQGKVLISDSGKNEFLYRSARNIRGVNVTSSSEIDVVDILGCETMIMSVAALNDLNSRLASKEG